MRHNPKTYIWEKYKDHREKDRREKVIDGIVVEEYDRRQKDDPNYNGPERRSGVDRRRSGMDKKIILLVTDSSNDERLIIDALQKDNGGIAVVVTRDSIETLDYLLGTGIYTGRNMSEMPQVVLLNLNLQKIEDLEVLRRLHNNERTKMLPVVVFSSLEDERILMECYRLGANSYIRKPEDSSHISEIVSQFSEYWLAFNELPPTEKNVKNNHL